MTSPKEEQALELFKKYPTVLNCLYYCALTGKIAIPGYTKDTITKNHIRRLIEQGSVKVTYSNID